MTVPSTGTEQQREVAAGLRDVHLVAITLWDCSVERGDAETLSIGTATAKVRIDPSIEEDSLEYIVSGTYTLENDEGAVMATIRASFLLSYEGSSVSFLSQDEIENFGQSVVMQVTPFQRELLATLTNRLGLPQFLLPLVRASEVPVSTQNV